MTWTVGRKISLVFGLFVLLLVSVSLVSYLQHKQAARELRVPKEEEGEAQRLLNFTEQVRRAERALLSQLAGGLAGSDDPGPLLARAHATLADLKSFASARVEEKEEKERHEQRERDLLNTMGDSLARIQTLRPTQSELRKLTEEQRKRIARDLLSHCDAITEAVRKFHSEDYTVVSAAIKRAKKATQSGAQVVFYTATGCVLAALVAAIYFVRKLTGPIKALRESARRIGEGDFDRPVIVTTSDEIGELAEDFKRMSARLKDSYADLEMQVSDKTRQLLHSARLAGIGTLATGIAHEINNPLASVASCAEGLLLRANSPALEQMQEFADFREYLEIIRSETERCSAITRNLLDFSRKQEPVIETVDLTERIHSVTALLKRKAESEHKTIKVIAHTDDPAVEADPAQLGQLFFNLINNALEAVHRGGTVEVRIEPFGEDRARVYVEDDGAGIPADLLDKIWEPFFTTKPPGEGTGLGLSLCYSIVENHQGTIECRSRGLDQGTTFVVTLHKHWSGESH